MVKPIHNLTYDSRTGERAQSGKTGSFKSSVPPNSVRPKPVILPKAK